MASAPEATACPITSSRPGGLSRFDLLLDAAESFFEGFFNALAPGAKCLRERGGSSSSVSSSLLSSSLLPPPRLSPQVLLHSLQLLR